MFYNLYKALTAVEIRQLVEGTLAEMIDWLTEMGAAAAYAKIKKHESE